MTNVTPLLRSPVTGLAGAILITVGHAIWLLTELPLGFGLTFIAVGVLLLILTPSFFVWSQPDASPTAPGGHRFPPRLLLLPPALALTYFTATHSLSEPTPSAWLLLGLWLLSIILSGLALVSLARWGEWLYEVRQSWHTERRTWLIIFGLTAAAFIIRAANIEGFPNIIAEDEGYFSWQAAAIKTEHGWRVNPFRYGVHHHPLLYHFSQALAIQVFGQTVFAARLPSIIYGALTIPAVYLLGRCCFGRRVGLVAALFMLTFGQALHFSRLALNQSMDPLFIALSLALLARALHTRQRVYFALAGITLGLSQYGFSSARLTPILALFFIAHFYLIQRRTGEARHQVDIFGLLTAALLFAVTLFPQAYFLQVDEAPTSSLAPRVDTVGLWDEDNPHGIAAIPPAQRLSFWEEQVTQSVLGFVIYPENGYFYGPYDPFLSHIAPVPFMIGLALALRRWRESRFAILVVWFLATAVLGGVLLNNPPEFQRFVIAIPALAILVALGLVYAAEVLVWLSRTLSPEQPMPRVIEHWLVPLALVVPLTMANFTTYFGAYRAHRPYFTDLRTHYLNVVADEVLPELEGYRVWYLPARNLNLTTSPILKYKNPGITTLEYLGEPAEFPYILAVLAQTENEPQAVLLARNYPRAGEALRVLSEIEGIQIEEVYHPHTGVLVVWVFRLAP